MFFGSVSDVRDRRLDVQRGGLLGDHADDLETSKRSRKELASRLQVARTSGISHQNRK